MTHRSTATSSINREELEVIINDVFDSRIENLKENFHTCEEELKTVIKNYFASAREETKEEEEETEEEVEEEEEEEEVRNDLESDIVRASVITVCGIGAYFIGYYLTSRVIRTVDLFLLKKK